jgi:transcriptional regulator GlxA family with amidase domain
MQLTTNPIAPEGAFLVRLDGVDQEAFARTSDVVIKLLRDGLSALDGHHSIAAACIERAHALLESQRERIHSETTSAPKGALATWQLRRVVAFIECRLETPLTMYDLAPLVRLSPGYFARAFKLSFGMTPHAYIYRRRMERAQELMLTTNETLCQIAAACGFADQAHFTRRFRQFFRETPNVWRRAHVGAYQAAA